MYSSRLPRRGDLERDLERERFLKEPPRSEDLGGDLMACLLPYGDL